MNTKRTFYPLAQQIWKLFFVRSLAARRLWLSKKLGNVPHPARRHDLMSQP